MLRFLVVEEVLVEVFKASPRDRAQQRFLEQITSTLQLVEVFTASPRDRAQQRFLEQITSTLPFLVVVLVREVLKVFPEDRVPQRLPLSRPSVLLVEVFKVFLPDMSPDSVLRSRTSTSQLPVSVPVAHPVGSLARCSCFQTLRGSAASSSPVKPNLLLHWGIVTSPSSPRTLGWP